MTKALIERARGALDYSRNFATAKPNIGATEKEHILGLCALVADLAAALTVKAGQPGEVERDAAAFRWASERAWFVDAGAHAFDLRFGPGDFTTEPRNADANDVRDAIYAAMNETKVTQ